MVNFAEMLLLFTTAIKSGKVAVYRATTMLKCNYCPIMAKDGSSTSASATGFTVRAF
jgi:hypothetical protein